MMGAGRVMFRGPTAGKPKRIWKRCDCKLAAAERPKQPIHFEI